VKYFPDIPEMPPAPHQRDRDREKMQNFISKPRYLANFEV